MPASIHNSRQLVLTLVREKLFSVARNSLIILTPVFWVAGFYGAFYHANVVILNHRVHDLRSFVYCLFVAPFMALLCGFLFWCFIIAPLQLLDWLIGELSDLLYRVRRTAFSRPAKDLTKR